MVFSYFGSHKSVKTSDIVLKFCSEIANMWFSNISHFWDSFEKLHFVGIFPKQSFTKWDKNI